MFVSLPLSTPPYHGYNNIKRISFAPNENKKGLGNLSPYSGSLPLNKSLPFKDPKNPFPPIQMCSGEEGLMSR